MLRRTAALLTALVLATGVAGCGSDDDSDHLASGDDFSIEAALAELPVPDTGDGPETRGLTVTVADVAAAAEANEAGEPPAADDADAASEWLLTATGAATEEGEDEFPPVFVPVPETAGGSQAAVADTFEEELGWSVLDVDAVAEVALPPFRFGVVTGDLGDDPLDEAGLEPDDDGVASLGEGEDFETDPADRTTARPIGAPLRLAADGDRLAVSTSTDAVAEWYDGEPATLAEDDALRAVAAALDETGAVSAYLTSLDPEAGYLAVGIGWAVEDGDPRIGVAYAFADEEAAEAAAEDVEAAWEADSVITAAPIADQLELDEVEVEGAVVVAHVHPGPEGRPQTALSMLIERDVPFTLAE